MGILTEGTETYLFVNGLTVDRSIRIGPNAQLQPACCDPSPDAIVKASKNEIDLGIVAIFLRQVASQVHLTSNNPKDLAALAWNTQWDVILLNAIFNCSVTCILQADTPAQSFGPNTRLNVIHRHLHGVDSLQPRKVNEQEALWLERNFENARVLLKEPNFMNAVHAMASHQWHPHPRAKLAILWSGIEGLFGIESELVFRISLYCARFLSPDNQEKRKSVFSNVKKLYKLRSSAVHGSQIGSKPDSGVAESAELLQSLIMKCIELNELPKPEALVP